MTDERTEEFTRRLTTLVLLDDNRIRCGGPRRPITRSVLKAMGLGKEEIDEEMVGLEDMGALCDCEVMRAMNGIGEVHIH